MRSLSMQSLTDATKRRHPGIVIYGKGDAAHALRVSGHNEDDTPGVRAEMSDADNVPEHRAIDLMLGPAFTRAQAYAWIDDVLADPAALKRLIYIIFDGHIWSRSHGWVKREFDGDDHGDHIHASGDAEDDENAAGWPAVEGGDVSVNDVRTGVHGLLKEAALRSTPTGIQVANFIAAIVNPMLKAAVPDLGPKLEEILAAAKDDGDTTVVLDPASMTVIQQLLDAVNAVPTAEETADELATRLAGDS